MPKRKSKFSYLSLGFDAMAVLLAYAGAYSLRFSGLIFEVSDLPSFIHYAKASLVIVPVVLIVFRNYRLYSVHAPLSRVDEIFSVIKGTTILFLILTALSFLYREFSYSRLVILLTYIFSIGGILLSRIFLRQWEKLERKRLKEYQSILIVGINRSSRRLCQRFRENSRYGFRVAGLLATDQASVGQHIAGKSVLGTIKDFDDMLETVDLQEVIVADFNLDRSLITEMMLKCESRMIRFRVVADFYGMMTSCVQVEYVQDVPLIGVREIPLDDAWNRLVKRFFDLGGSALGMILLSPIFAIISLLVWWTDRGPILYRQERMGLDGKVFDLLKFRTMKVAAEKESGPVWTKEKDDRVLPIGKFLRKSNLDELPQIWNVFCGEMSLVGPRPERPFFVEQFKDRIPRYMTRHKIKAGITGWAQVHGFRGNTSLKERIKYDLFYMENWSPVLDLKIILRTFGAFKNAY